MRRRKKKKKKMRRKEKRKKNRWRGRKRMEVLGAGYIWRRAFHLKWTYWMVHTNIVVYGGGGTVAVWPPTPFST